MKKNFIFLSLFLVAVIVQAKDIIVTNALDGIEVLDGDVVVTPIPEGSFRAAVLNAESGDVIKFNIPGKDEIVLVDAVVFSGEEKALTVDGMNMSTNKSITFKKAAEAKTVRLFNIATSKGSAGLNVTLKNLHFKDIYTEGYEATGAVISSGNSAYRDLGAGAITVTLDNCWFKNCTIAVEKESTMGGGGVYFVSHGTKLIINSCLFEGNKMIYSDQEGEEVKTFGGGVIGSTGTNTAKLEVTNSTFAGNSSASRGGAIFIGHPTDLINCTIAGNNAGRGGGFYMHASGLTVNIINTIITHNYCSNQSYNGDLCSNNTTNLVLNVNSSLVAQSALFDLELLDQGVKFDTSGPLFKSYTSGDKPTPILEDNGGSTLTLALGANGAANGTGISKLEGFVIPTVDQRGYDRKAKLSMGAFEYGASAPSSIEDLMAKEQKILFADRTIHISDAGEGTINVYNVLGEIVSRDNNDLSHLSQGIYVIQYIDRQTSKAYTLKVLLK